MCEIKRLRTLKKRQQKIVDLFNRENPLSILPQNYVSSTGLTYSDIKEKIDKISDCASIIELRDSFVQVGNTYEQIMKVAAANYCKQHTVCPVCSDRLQSRRRAHFQDPIKKQAEMVEENKRFAYLVTYTIKDGESLSERLDHLKESKKAFRKMGQRRGSARRSRGEAGKIKAGISTIEIKRGKKSKLWHVHSHDLVFTDSPIDYSIYDKGKKRKLDQIYGKKIPADKLRSAALNTVYFSGSVVPASKVSTEWLRATGGDSMSISVERIRHIPKNVSGKKKRMFQKMTFVQSVSYQAKEVLKYITKPDENNIADSLIVLNETYNKRMVATYGEFRGVTADDYNDNPDEKESFVMVWKNGNYSDAMPGKVRDIVSDDEKETRSKVGKLLGEYRRRRKYYLQCKESGVPAHMVTMQGKRVLRVIGDDLHEILDDLKHMFRNRVSFIWSQYRRIKKAAESAEIAKCDKYSAVLSTAGMYMPGSSSKDLYLSVF